MFDEKDPNNKKIISFFSSKKVLIVDPSASNRQSLNKCIRKLGSDSQNIHSVKSILEAQSEMKTHQPHIVICPNELDETSHTLLLDEHLKIYPNRLKTVFIIISAENSKATSAIVLDSEIDGFLSSPFTAQSVEDVLLDLTREKIAPVKSLQTIENTKELIFNEKYEDAISSLSPVREDPTYGPLACYYEGLILIKLEKDEEAKKALQDGLEKNPKHYKCARALSDIYFEQKLYLQSYELECMLSEAYPINPNRIPSLTRISLASQKYEDILNYCEVFRSLKEQSNTIKKYIAAGLALCGKYLMKEGDTDKAIQMLMEASEMSDGNGSIIETVSTALVSKKKLKEMKIVLTQHVSDTTPERVTDVMEFLLFAEENTVSDIFRMGRQLITKGVKHEALYSVMLRKGIEGGMKFDRIEDLYFEAKNACPDYTYKFDKLLSYVKQSHEKKMAKEAANQQEEAN